MNSSSSGTIRVLHVDDDPDLTELAATFLEREDDRFVVETAGDAAEGLRRLESQEFDCVVSDYEMPGRNGIEFLQVVRSEYPELPFLLFTGKGSEAVASDAMSAGVTDYLQKEAGTDQYTVLANRIANAVEHHRSRQLVERSERRLREIVDSLPQLLYVVDEDGTYQLVNESVAEFLGTEVAEIEGSNVDDVLDDDTTEQFRADIESVLESNAPKRIPEIEVDGANGETRIFAPRLLPYDLAETDKRTALGISFDVTERQVRQRELERANALLSTLFDTLPVGVLAEDESRNVLRTNRQVFDLLELPGEPDEIVGADCERLADELGDPLDEPEEFAAQIDERVEARKPVNDEPIGLTDGRTLLRSYRPVELPDGDGHLWTYRDVTPQREREQRLNRLQKRTRALMDTRTVEATARVATDAANEVIDARLSGVHLVNDAGNGLEPVTIADKVNEVFDQTPSYSRDAPEGSRAALVWEVFESGEPMYIDNVSKYEPLSEETPAKSAILFPVGDHGVFVVSAEEADAFSETDETLVEILASTLKTALDRVEHELEHRERSEQLERLQEVTVSLMRTDDHEAIAELVVEAAEEILGFPIVMVRSYEESENGLVPLAFSDHVTEELGERPVFTPERGSYTWEVFESGEPQILNDIRANAPDVDDDLPLQSIVILPMGDFGTLAAGATEPAVFDDSDRSMGQILATAASAAFERTDRESELRTRRNELERKNERLEEFASVVSHDLRNPLTTLNGSVEMAEQTGDSEHFERSYRAIDRMETMIDDLLTLARQGETISDPESVDLSRIATRCWRAIDSDATRLVVETNRTIFADSDRLIQLLGNLFRNSVEHGSPSSRVQADNAAGYGSKSAPSETTESAGEPAQPELIVTIGDLEDGFYVADDGDGIHEDVRDQIFESGVSTSTENTGFGLAIVEQIAEAHGWTVEVTESADGGARFEVRNVDTPQ